VGYIAAVTSGSQPRRTAIAAAVALACFAAGVGVNELAHRRAAPAPPSAAAPPRPARVDDLDAGAPTVVAPAIVFDPSSIDLLPDASLTLSLPRGFDAGAR
jgi:hypothetical protein